MSDQHDKWTVCDEVLPGPSAWVLAYCPAYDDYYCWKIARHDKGKWSGRDGLDIAGEVTHWRPLPPAPKPLPPRDMLELAHRLGDLEEMRNVHSMDRNDEAVEMCDKEIKKIEDAMRAVPIHVMKDVAEMKELLDVHAPGIWEGDVTTRRIDAEGRDVTDLPGLWGEEDTECSGS